VEDGFGRARALAALAAHDGGLVPEALTALARRGAQPADGVRELAPAVLALPPDDRLKAFGLAVRAFDGHARGELLSGLEALAPVVASLGGGGAVAVTADAVVATGRWFP
jgi:hypothetical protein